MKYLKMLGLAAVAAMALTAFVGASSASAAVLCKAQPSRSGVCEGGKYPSGTVFEATASKAVLTVTGSAVVSSVTCHSVVKLKNTAEAGSPGVPGEISDLTFDECKTNTGSTCEATTTSGYVGELTPTNDSGSGTLHVTGTGTAQQTTMTCGTFFQCKYSPTANGVNLSFTGGNPAKETASEQELTLISGFGFGCGTSAKWDAEYTAIGANSAVWVATS